MFLRTEVNLGNKKPKNNILNIAICDDEPIILAKIIDLVKSEFQKQGIKVNIFSFEKGEDIFHKQNIYNFDVIFLDIELKASNGLEIAKKLRKSSYNNLIVFITSFVNYVLDGYKTDAFRFILKSNLESQLSECIEAIAENLKSTKYQMSDELIAINDILYAMSDNRKITVYLKNGKTKTEYMKLDDFEEKLNSKSLCRVHQSYLINIAYVEFITRYEITLIDDIIIPVSKSRYKEANKQIKLRRTLWS